MMAESAQGPVRHQLIAKTCKLLITNNNSPAGTSTDASFQLMKADIAELHRPGKIEGGVHEAYHACRAATRELHLLQERSLEDLTGLLLDPGFVERWCVQRHSAETYPSLGFTAARDRDFFLRLLQGSNPLCFAVRHPAAKLPYLSEQAPPLHHVIVLLVFSLEEHKKSRPAIQFEGMHLPASIDEFRRLISFPRHHLRELTRGCILELIHPAPLETMSCFYSLVAYWSFHLRTEPFSTKKLPSCFRQDVRHCTGLDLVERQLGEDPQQISQFVHHVLRVRFMSRSAVPSGTRGQLLGRYQEALMDIYSRVATIMRVHALGQDLAAFEKGVCKLLETDLKLFATVAHSRSPGTK